MKLQEVLDLEVDTSEPRIIKAYHGGPVPIRRFSLRKTAMGIIWFSEDKDKIIRGEAGIGTPKYIMECELSVNKTAGWKEYDKLMLDQISQMGYDSIHYEDNWILFDPKRAKIIKIERIIPKTNEASQPEHPTQKR